MWSRNHGKQSFLAFRGRLSSILTLRMHWSGTGCHLLTYTICNDPQIANMFRIIGVEERRGLVQGNIDEHQILKHSLRKREWYVII